MQDFASQKVIFLAMLLLLPPLFLLLMLHLNVPIEYVQALVIE